MPLREKQLAALAITALAAGAGPPEKSIATRRIEVVGFGGLASGVFMAVGSGQWAVGSGQCGGRLAAALVPRSWLAVGGTKYEVRAPRPYPVHHASFIISPQLGHVRSMNVVSTRASMKAGWSRICWWSGTVVLTPFDPQLAQGPAHAGDGLRRGSAGGRSACRSSNRSRGSRV